MKDPNMNCDHPWNGSVLIRETKFLRRHLPNQFAMPGARCIPVLFEINCILEILTLGFIDVEGYSILYILQRD
jgi:hypothetical protein